MQLLNYTKLMRFKTSVLIGLSSVLGGWFYFNQNTVYLEPFDISLKILSAFLLVTISSGSLNLFNDIVDLRIDKELKPERILPQNLVTIKKAYIFFILLTISCLMLSIYLNELIIVIYVIMFIIGVNYSLFFQNIPLVKNFVVAFSISMSILVGYLSLITNHQFELSYKMITIFILSLFSIFGFELQKDINDVEIDKKYNKRTFPSIFGKGTSAKLVYSIYWVIIFAFWIYLLFFDLNANIFIVFLLILIQMTVLVSIRNITFDQSYYTLEKARIRIYFLFAITLISLFLF